MRGLYLHIPFCKHICAYCDFPKRIAKNKEQVKTYVSNLLIELETYKKYFSSVKTIYIGGGTPNSLELDDLALILKYLHTNFNDIVEFSIECNPELLTKEQIALFLKYGVNRVSLGVESFFNDDLIRLNRHHTNEKTLDAIRLLKEQGLTNINLDLIFGHPFDSIAKVKETLSIIKKLDINHISYYSLILEDKTIFNHLINKNELKLLDDDITANMYELIIKEMKEAGYHHYETSNFAKPGFESRHNLIYWQEEEYIGVGLGASGFLENIRYTNSSILKDYYYGKKEKTLLTLTDIKNEYMMLGFRKIDGISLNDYYNRFKANLIDDFNLDKLLNRDLIKIENDTLKLTKKGIMLANEVFMEFV